MNVSSHVGWSCHRFVLIFGCSFIENLFLERPSFLEKLIFRELILLEGSFFQRAHTRKKFILRKPKRKMLTQIVFSVLLLSTWGPSPSHGGNLVLKKFKMCEPFNPDWKYTFVNTLTEKDGVTYVSGNCTSTLGFSNDMSVRENHRFTFYLPQVS